MISSFEAEVEQVCCGEGNPCEGPPTTCSHECASLFVPFMKRCGRDFMATVPVDDDEDIEDDD